MRRRNRAMALMAAGATTAALAGCGSGASGPPAITGQALGNSLAVAAKNRYEGEGQFATQVGDQGGTCQGGGARWTCRLDIVLRGTLQDLRTYDMTVDGKGCWVARQTATDVGVTGRGARPDHPDVLTGCLK